MSLLTSFNWLFNPAWVIAKVFTLWMDGGDGGSPAPTTTTVQNSNLPDYVQPYVMSNLGGAQNQLFNLDGSGNITGVKPYVPYSSNPADYVAGFSPLQQQSQTGVANLQMPQQFADASNATAAAIGQAANAQYTPMASGYMTTQAPDLQNYQMRNPGNVSAPDLRNYQMGPAQQVRTQNFTGNAVDQYMNPYIQETLNPQLADISHQYDVAAMQGRAAAGARGAYGGNRATLAESELQRNRNQAMNSAISQGYNTAFNNAQQQFNTQQNARLQAQQANQNAGLTVGQQNLAAKLGVQQLGAGQDLQSQLANQQNAFNTNNANLQAKLGVQSLGSGQNLQSQLANQGAYGQEQALAANQQQFGANYGLQNLQQMLAGANQLGNLGGSQLNAQQGIYNAQAAAGATQQQQQQNIINNAINNYAMAQQYPMQAYSQLSSLLHGLPLQNTTTQSYQAAPSTISQLGGLAATGLGAYGAFSKKKGGVIKMRSGGLIDLGLYNAMKGSA